MKFLDINDLKKIREHIIASGQHLEDNGLVLDDIKKHLMAEDPSFDVKGNVCEDIKKHFNVTWED